MLGSTPLGEAARDAVPLALRAKNADKVDSIHASRIPKPGYLVPLGKNGRFPQAVGAIGPPGVAGLVLVSVDTALDSSSPKAAQASCPDGKKALGGGAELTENARSSVALTDSRPLANAAGWYAAAAETVAYPSSWALRTWAVCAAVS